ncbi:hypothetical protein R3W88_033674 [Solanum pinnatisectum]|uniref:Uncharacterized protein n=1 Tax=Solanum pinnatisectum TaxID=50273 RepID=A0AAV9K0H7_9SOLN|nr:hypothetical protein R3W88_033674 [Solanum pinnatisectum]
MFFDTPRTWILYEPMDRDKSLLLAMTSSFTSYRTIYIFIESKKNHIYFIKENPLIE